MTTPQSRLCLLLSAAGFCLYCTAAEALIPTVDAGAIAEGVKSNIELVKQSAVVAEATSIAGQMNSAIGSAKSSISKLGLDEAKAAAERIKKEKENLEKAKAEYDKYKAEYEAQKQKLEEGKAEYERLKSQAQEGLADVQELKSDITDTADMLKAKASDAASSVSSSRQAFGSTATSSSTSTTATTTPQTQTVQQPQAQTQPVQQPQAQPAQQPQTQTVVQDNKEELAEAQAEIQDLRRQLAEAQMQAQNSASSTPNVIQNNNDDTPEKLEDALAEIERLKAELAAYEEAAQQSPNASSSTNSTSLPQAQTPTLTQPLNSSGFRKRPTVNVNTEFEKQSFNDTNSSFAVASVSSSSTLFFAKADTEASGDESATSLDSLLNTPTGTNAATDEFIVSDELARYCGFNVNNVDTATLRSCLADLIAYRSDSNALVAAEGNAKYTKIMQESVTGLASEAVVDKNEATNYQAEVLSKLNSDLGSASTVRDDIAALAQTNNQVQILLNNILKIYASQLYLSSMEGISKYNSKTINPEDSGTITPASDSTETKDE